MYEILEGAVRGGAEGEECDVAFVLKFLFVVAQAAKSHEPYEPVGAEH